MVIRRFKSYIRYNQPHKGSTFSPDQLKKKKSFSISQLLGRSISSPAVISNFTAYSASDRALPSGAAGPRLPSVAALPLRLSLRVALRSVADEALAPSAAESRAPFGCCGSPPSSIKPRLIFSRKGDSPFRCSRAASSLRTQ